MGENWGGGIYLGTWSIHVFRDINISIQIVSILDMDLDLNMFDLQHLERSLHQGHQGPAHVIVSEIRNILMSVGSLDDDWFKSYAHICKTLVSICVTLTLVRFLPNLWYAMCSTRWNKCKKTGIISLSYLMLWWYECWCYWQIMPYPL